MKISPNRIGLISVYLVLSKVIRTSDGMLPQPDNHIEGHKLQYILR